MPDLHFNVKEVICIIYIFLKSLPSLISVTNPSIQGMSLKKHEVFSSLCFSDQREAFRSNQEGRDEGGRLFTFKISLSVVSLQTYRQ